MRRRIAVMAVTICSMNCAWPAGAPLPVIERAEEIAKRLEGQWRGFDPPRPRTGVRELFSFALEAAATGTHLDKVDRALELAEAMQDRDPKSRTFGNFKWYWEADAPHDLNAVQFSMQQAVLVWMLYRERLTPAAAERLERLLRFGVEGVRRHGVGEAYTNIFLMKTWNCVALGEATGRPDLAAEGYRMLDRWLLFTWEHGIHEYVSPTYYGVDLDSLGLLAKFAKRSETRRDAEAALRLFWTDIAANWFPPAKRLGGAHSRDYDYLTGRGTLHAYLRRLGWTDDEPVRAAVFEQLCWWPPPADVLRVGEQVPRLVHQRWGKQPWERAVHYVGRRVSIGSGGACYNPEDKPFAVNFAGGWRMPVLYFVMDARGDPYGQQKFLTGKSGHHKAWHIEPFLATVQRGSEVLLLAHGDPADKTFRVRAPEPTCLLSHLVIPSKVGLWVSDKPVTLGKGEKAEVPPGRPVFLRFEDVVVGLRVVLARDTEGKPAPASVVNDGPEALRLTVTHSAVAPKAPGTVAFWARAAEGLDDAAFAEFRKRFAESAAAAAVEGGVFDVSVPGEKGALRLRANLATRERLALEGGEPGAEGFLLAINGRDYGREILRQVPAIARRE